VTADWDAATYHVVSAPQQEWGRRVLDRLALEGSESVADVGCGTGRLTAQLFARVPRGRLTAIDRSPAMLSQARLHLSSDRVAWVRASADALPFNAAFDVVFSTATFHWVLDHDALFSSLFVALKPGGRLHAQCGGGPNLARLRRRAAGLLRQPPYAACFDGWQEPWQYADPGSTERRLSVAGFRDISTSLEPAPVRFDKPAEFRAFCENVCLHPYLNRLPVDTRASFADELVKLAECDDPPFVLDYWRLNLTARKPESPGRA
jgi:SAM-dependent methyltransferase